MPDRVLRAELLESEAWLALKDNADRAAWVSCILTVDNFGDMPAGLNRLARLWRPYGLDTAEKAAHTIANLSDVDLARRYEVDQKPFIHIPRFKQRLRYVGNAYPLSPWATIEEKQLYEKKSPVNRRPSPVNSGEQRQERSEVKRSKFKSASMNTVAEIPQQTVDNFPNPNPQGKIAVIENPQTEKRESDGQTGQQWSSMAYVAATAKTLAMERRQGEADAEFRDRVFDGVKRLQVLARGAKA